VCGISELSLVPSITNVFYDRDIFCVCFDVRYSLGTSIPKVASSIPIGKMFYHNI
jgi:hypothetical protein